MQKKEDEDAGCLGPHMLFQLAQEHTGNQWRSFTSVTWSAQVNILATTILVTVLGNSKAT